MLIQQTTNYRSNDGIALLKLKQHKSGFITTSKQHRVVLSQHSGILAFSHSRIPQKSPFNSAETLLITEPKSSGLSAKSTSSTLIINNGPLS